jgi:hypothetical protein
VWESPGNTALQRPGTTIEAGQYGHFSGIGLTAEVAEEGVVQWCVPARRQQAGKFEAASARTTGTISGKLSSVSSKDASARRI